MGAMASGAGRDLRRGVADGGGEDLWVLLQNVGDWAVELTRIRPAGLSRSTSSRR